MNFVDRACEHCGRLEHDPGKWTPVFPRNKCEAFARRSCSHRKIVLESDSTQLKQTLTVYSAFLGKVVQELVQRLVSGFMSRPI
jgi:hypothetical protein